MASDPHLTLWYSALATPRGVRLSSTDRRYTIQRLYAARAAAADPSLDGLSIVISPKAKDEFYIVKREPDGPDASE